MFPYVVSFIDGWLGGLKTCHFIRVSLFYTKAVNKRLFEQVRVAWTGKETDESAIGDVEAQDCC